MKKTILLVVFVLLALPVSNIWAASVGDLLLEKGLVKVRRNNVDTIYRDQGQTVSVQNLDEIQTGFDTRVTIRLTGKDEAIELFSKSFFVVSNVNAEQSSVYMPTGKARFKITAKKRVRKGRRAFRLRTANAMIGVKGTDFVVGASDGDTSLLTLSGAVSFASLAAPDVEVEVGSNQASKIQASKPPTVPIDVPPQVREEVIQGDTTKAFENIEFGELSEDQEADQDKKETQTEEEAAEEPDTAVDDLFEDVNENVDAIQEDLQDTQSQPKSVKFKIVDQ
jgi:hypothetical protein